MGFFTVLAARADPIFAVHKLDLNIWLLPGLFGRTVAFCDIGIKLSVREEVRPDDLGLTVGMPFLSDGKPPTDLIPSLQVNRTANLVFGNGAAAPQREQGPEGLLTYDDEDDEYSPVFLLPCDESKSKITTSTGESTAYTTYSIVPRAALRPGRFYYMRLRFRATKLGQLWTWQRAGGRRSYAIADLRVNEFRDLPEVTPPPFWAGSVPLGRVNFFLVVTAKLKEQRRSPEPRYLRALEVHSWENYLGRRLSRRKDESFLIYYWRKENVSELSSLRAFLEVEKRRPTAAVYTWMSSATTLLVLILIWPSFDISKTMAADIFRAGWAVLLGIGVGGAVVMITRGTQFLITNWGRLASWLERREARAFRLKK